MQQAAAKAGKARHKPKATIARFVKCAIRQRHAPNGKGRLLQWVIPALGVAVLAWAVGLAFQGRFAVAFGIGVFAACVFQIEKMRQRLNRR